MLKSRLSALALSGLVAVSLSGSPLAASADASNTYEVTVTNLTASQILSPPLVAAHKPASRMFEVGQPASDGVWMVAESGNSGLLAEMLKGRATDVQRAEGPILPGASIKVRITAEPGDVLSMVAMLAQTNDGFMGLDGAALSPQGGTVDVMAFDAGTEENTERMVDVPGPPFGGMGHQATSPVQPITPHPGILGAGDIPAQFNWSGAVARIEVAGLSAGRPAPGLASLAP